MYEESKGFKTSLMGGFNREDVLRYIEQAARESGERIEALQQENDRLAQERDELRERNQALSKKNADLLERLGEMTLADEQRSGEAEKLAQQAARDAETLRAACARLTEAESENEALREQAERLAEQAAEYEASKENIADMELCAHRRARDLEARAEFDARRVRMQSAEVVSALKKQLADVADEYRTAAATAKRTAEANERRAAEAQQKLDEVLTSLDAVVVGELATNEPEGQERPRVQRVLDILCGREGD